MPGTSQTPTSSKTNGPRLPCPWTGCEVDFGRQQEWERHILTFHLPDCYCCPAPACPWRSRRKDSLKMHIDEGMCGPRPEWEEQWMIYNPKLILQWICEDFISIEFAETYALDFVQERARELGKVDAWRDPWRYHDGPQEFVMD
ncbi:hypothetical protein DFH94DRAFT_841959 [Russula ochroleuca]|uniref:C2H2-type domain-containing protein n=1 Tax=Russula ochroleuca TaxID=152965 RepID=A0A9P5N469_9AGAM|nr:hypothetical protein DFH94DRAFT_841959 [Russula ochroleuca]